jgi:hypothetical protein
MEKGIRHFHIELDESGDTIEFYPLDDMAGCTKLTSVSINGKLLDITQFADYKYMPKISGHYTIPITNNNKKLNIDISWDYQSNNEFLLAHV